MKASCRGAPATLGAVTLLIVGVLLICDVFPRLFQARVHDYVAATSLALIAFAYAAYQATQRASPKEWAKTILVVFAFLFWAANQVCSDRRMAMLFNDAAIAAFIFDVFLAIIGWPPREAGEPPSARTSTGPFGASGDAGPPAPRSRAQGAIQTPPCPSR